MKPARVLIASGCRSVVLAIVWAVAPPAAAPRAWAEPAQKTAAAPQELPTAKHWEALARGYELLACPPDLRHALRTLRGWCLGPAAPTDPQRSPPASEGGRTAPRPPRPGAGSAVGACRLSSFDEAIKVLESDLRMELRLRLQHVPHAVLHFDKSKDGDPDASFPPEREKRLLELTAGPLLDITRFLLITGDADGRKQAEARLATVRQHLIKTLGVPASQIERPWLWLLAPTSKDLLYPVFDLATDQEPGDITRSVYILRIDCR